MDKGDAPCIDRKYGVTDVTVVTARTYGIYSGITSIDL